MLNSESRVLFAHLYVFYLYQIVYYGVDGEACHAVDAEFAGNILAMRQDGIERNEEFFGHFLISHAAHDALHDFLLAGRELFLVLFRFVAFCA